MADIDIATKYVSPNNPPQRLVTWTALTANELNRISAPPGAVVYLRNFGGGTADYTLTPVADEYGRTGRSQLAGLKSQPDNDTTLAIAGSAGDEVEIATEGWVSTQSGAPTRYISVTPAAGTTISAMVRY